MHKNTKKTRLVGYHRRSTGDVFCRIQCFGENISRVFVDEDIAVEASRPELSNMIGVLQEGDVVVVESLSSLGYCFSDLQSVIAVVLEKGCSVRIRDENLTFCAEDHLSGQSSLQLLGAFSRVEKTMLSGLLAMNGGISGKTAQASESKTKMRESNAKASVDSSDASRLRDMIEAGASNSRLQAEFNLSVGAINRFKATS